MYRGIKTERCPILYQSLETFSETKVCKVPNSTQPELKQAEPVNVREGPIALFLEFAVFNPGTSWG